MIGFFHECQEYHTRVYKCLVLSMYFHIYALALLNVDIQCVYYIFYMDPFPTFTVNEFTVNESVSDPKGINIVISVEGH